MPSVTSSIGSLISSIVDTITSIISTFIAIIQNIFSTIFDLIGTILSTFGTFISGVVETFGGIFKFLLGNILVLATLVIAVGGYIVYQNKRGGSVTVPGSSKKLN